MKKKILICSIFLITFIFSLEAANPEVLLLTTTEKSYDNDISLTVLTKAYSRLNIKVNVEYYPSLRSLDMSNSGKSDGEIHRIAGIEENYPNLVRVKIPVQYIEFYFFSKNMNLKPQTWAEAANFNSSYIRGVLFVEKNLGKYNLPTENNQFELFRALENARYDGVIASLSGGIYTIKSSGYKDIFPVSKIGSIPLYHYLNKKHRKLVPQIEKSLREMEKSGEIRRVSEEMIENIMK